MMKKGVVIKGIGGFYYVRLDNGEIVECRARGKFRKDKIKPMVGDIASVSDDGALVEICERKNALIRPPVANIDCIVIVVAAGFPEPDFLMIDKLTVMARIAEIEVIVAVNKTDLASPDGILKIYNLAGFKTVPVSAATGDGIQELKNLIRGKVCAFAGNSGVGKSSLLNCFGFDAETGDISKINRGKHTTRHSELMPYEDGYIADTPGFSVLEMKNIKASELDGLFPEFLEHKDKCRFADCVHINTKDDVCEIAKAVSNGLISQSRYNSYRELYDSLKEIKEWEND